jgi:allophanate hydrolase
MSGVLEIVSPGAMASIQDLGRLGLRRLGVPRSGALEPGWLRLANALSGNAESAPALEFFDGGLSVRALESSVRLALAGHFSVELACFGERRRLDSWRTVTLALGATLRCGPLAASRVGYVAVAGIRVARQLGSASTYARAALGGLDGRPLLPGARLLAAEFSGGEKMLRTPPGADGTAIRVVLGPQDDYFDAASMERFLHEAYTVSQAADRMGVRLDGPLLRHRPEKGVEIISDATVPGSIQVPAQGRPIVLLADGQTAGGYPKIATVISADLPRLAVMAPGQVVRFVAVPVAVAEVAARVREAALGAMISSIGPLAEAGALDLQAMYAANLVSGVVDARALHGAGVPKASSPGEE